MGRLFLSMLTVGLLSLTGRSAETAPRPVDSAIAAIFESESYRVVRFEIEGERAVIGVEVARDIPLWDLPADFENRFETVVGRLAATHPEVQRIDLGVAHPGQALRAPPRRPFDKPQPRPPLRSIRPDASQFPYGQALAGRTIAISPGHGHIYYDSLGRYSTQRGNIKWGGCGTCRGIIEDFETHEIAIRYLIPLLEGAGARVVLVRERDYHSQRAIVDDLGPGYAELSGVWADGTSGGGNEDDYRATFEVDAAAEWTIAAPVTGEQLLTMWFVAGQNRTSTARLEVLAGGDSHSFLVDLKTHGQRFAPVGLFDLVAGESMQVRLRMPVDADGSEALVADAVRLGAGAHDSGFAWWSMGANPYAIHTNAPSAIQSRGDVTTRPRIAEFYGADIYVALHSNASGQPNSTAAGSVTYRYNCGTFPAHSNDPPASQCDDPSGSDRLQEIVHDHMVEQITADWDPNWSDRGTKVANFGEVRELDGIPGILIESAFHDNLELPGGSPLRMTDNQALHDPRWRRATAEGIYRGITEYFVSGGPIVARPPTGLVIRRLGRGRIEVDFSPVSNAAGYKIYVARNGRTYDQGQIFEALPAVIDNVGQGPVAVRVSSLNEAGEGWKGRAMAVRASGRPAQILIVDGFDREDAWVQEFDNTKNTAVVHARALGASDFAFDSADEQALIDERVNFANYDGVVFAFGRESTEHDILTPELRAFVADYVQSGGAVFASGTEIGWTLGERGDSDSQAFLSAILGVAFAADSANADAVTPAPGGWLAGSGVANFALSDGTDGRLDAKFQDVFTAAGAGVAELLYPDATLAGVRTERTLVLGFPVESVVAAEGRAALLGAWAGATLTLAPEDPLPPDAGVADVGTPDSHPVDASVVDAGFMDVETDAGEDGKTPTEGGCGCRTESPIHGVTTLPFTLLLGLFLVRRKKRVSPR